MTDTHWHDSHTEDPPTLPEVHARWCANCGRMIRTDRGDITVIGMAECVKVSA